MLKPLEIPTIKPAAERVAASHTEDANNVFRVMHGFYGNLFLSKFATGEARADGGDGGVASARAIWAHGLRGFDVEVVKTALARTLDAHPEYPPTLPQFVALCRACAPRATYKPEIPAIAMSQELRSRNAARAREISVRHATGVAAKQAPPAGLPTLKALIAGAVSAAGGDEAAELNRLDRLYQSKAQGVPT